MGSNTRRAMGSTAKVTRPARAALLGLGLAAALGCATPAQAVSRVGMAPISQIRAVGGAMPGIAGEGRMQQGPSLSQALGLSVATSAIRGFGMLPGTTTARGPQVGQQQGVGTRRGGYDTPWDAGTQQGQAGFTMYGPTTGTAMQTTSPLVRDLVLGFGRGMQMPGWQQGPAVPGTDLGQGGTWRAGAYPGGMPALGQGDPRQQPDGGQGQGMPATPTTPTEPTASGTNDTPADAGTTTSVVDPVTVDIDIPEDITAAFSLSDRGITVIEGDAGYKTADGKLTISAAGHYYVTGSCSDGSIQVKKGTTGVTLTLADLTLTSTTTAPLAVNKGAEAVINVEGVVTLNDSEDLANDTEDNEDFEGAAIKVKGGGMATITGTGTLNVNGTCKNGIKGGDGATVTLAGATVNVSAANTGIACDNVVSLAGGTVSVTAANEGVKAEADEDDTASAGIVNLSGSALTVNAGDDGVQASGEVNVTAGSVAVIATSDGIQGGGSVNVRGGTLDVTTFGGYGKARSLGSDASAKGLKSDRCVSVTGGTMKLNCADDAIHSDGDVTLAGGSALIYSGDDGVHADGSLSVADGDIDILASYEGMEATNVVVKGGDITITSSDDGVNAANKDARNAVFTLDVSGGTMYVNAGGDGLDSNGSMTNTGGTVEVYGSNTGGNGATDIGDWGATWAVSGGTVLAGGVDMAVTPTSGTYVLFGGGQGMGGGMGMGGRGASAGGSLISQGAAVSVTDSAGNVIFDGTAAKGESYVIFASPSLVSGQAYTLRVNGSAVATATAGTGSAGGMQRGWSGQPGQTGTQPGQMGTRPGQQGQIGQMSGQQMGGQPGGGMNPGMGR